MDSLDSCHIERVYTSYLVIALIPMGNGPSFHICQEQRVALGFFFFSLLTLLTTQKLAILMIASSSCLVMHEVSLDIDTFFQLPFFSNYFLQFPTFDLQPTWGQFWVMVLAVAIENMCKWMHSILSVAIKSEEFPTFFLSFMW